METPNRYLALGWLWFALVALQLYHFHTDEATLSWLTGLTAVAYALSGCYFVWVGVRSAD